MYFVAVPMIEKLVDPQTKERRKLKYPSLGFGPAKDQSNLGWFAKVEGRGLSGSYAFGRDILRGVIDTGEVAGGIFTQAGRDLMKVTHPKTAKWNRTDAENYIRGLNGVFNTLTGVGAPNSVPRAGIFGTEYHMGKEKPQTLREWWTGITHGTAHPRR